ncbi:unnamed protein product, partial [Timema podura]|nr:unnamed protein product [Timema podura]
LLALPSASLKPILWDGGREGERCGVASQPTKVSFRANKNRWITKNIDGASYWTAQDASHTINILKSPTAPLAKKRQIMRNTFGDYRAKMAEEENQFRKGNIQMRFNTLSPSKKSSFVKKSTSIIKKRFEPSNNGFNFNFSDISPSEKVVEDVSGLNCTTTGEATDKVDFFEQYEIPSGQDRLLPVVSGPTPSHSRVRSRGAAIVGKRKKKINGVKWLDSEKHYGLSRNLTVVNQYLFKSAEHKWVENRKCQHSKG